MEKLIELLNKYDEIREYAEVDLEDELISLKIISKWYGFIKWLVENDKINRGKFYDKNILKGFMTLTKEEKADSIIMNLSVQDEPIEFLVSILK